MPGNSGKAPDRCLSGVLHNETGREINGGAADRLRHTVQDLHLRQDGVVAGGACFVPHRDLFPAGLALHRSVGVQLSSDLQGMDRAVVKCSLAVSALIINEKRFTRRA